LGTQPSSRREIGFSGLASKLQQVA
jgi:hypothetical protein